MAPGQITLGEITRHDAAVPSAASSDGDGRGKKRTAFANPDAVKEVIFISDGSDSEESESDDSDDSEEAETNPNPKTPMPVPKGKPKKRKRETSEKNSNNNMPKKMAITPSTTMTARTTTDPFMDAATSENINSSAIPLSFEKHRGKVITPPAQRSQSSSSSSAQSTPTRPPSKSRRIETPGPRLLTVAEAAQKAKQLTDQLKMTIQEHGRVSVQYADLIREGNPTPDILDLAVETTKRRAQRAHAAISAHERDADGNNGNGAGDGGDEAWKNFEELYMAARKAHADRENWYAHTRRLFYVSTKLEGEASTLKQMVEQAKKDEDAARQREGAQQVATPTPAYAATSTPGSRGAGVVALSSGRRLTNSGVLHKPSAALTRIRTELRFDGETPLGTPSYNAIASPALSLGTPVGSAQKLYQQKLRLPQRGGSATKTLE